MHRDRKREQRYEQEQEPRAKSPVSPTAEHSQPKHEQEQNEGANEPAFPSERRHDDCAAEKQVAASSCASEFEEEQKAEKGSRKSVRERAKFESFICPPWHRNHSKTKLAPATQHRTIPIG